jgi:2,3-dihydroxybiphenyl 1,2-dioxygenase
LVAIELAARFIDLSFLRIRHMPATSTGFPEIVGVCQLGYLGFGVSDPAAWREFATEVLGLQENGGNSRGSAFYRMDSHHYRFEVCPSGEDDLLWAGWEAKDEVAFQAIAQQVRALGVKVTECSEQEAAERMVLGLIRFEDPEGLQTEIYHGPLIDPKQFISPRGIGGFKADEQGLGHFVMMVRDLDVMLDFYMRALGVKVSDFMNIARGTRQLRVCFTHVNPRHHSLAMVGQAPGSAPQAPPTKTKKINHFMIEAKELDDVGIALDIFKQRGMPVGQIGKHTNDWMISFYAHTPSGFSVEYGWNGRSIDDEATWDVQNRNVASVWGHAMPVAAATEAAHSGSVPTDAASRPDKVAV